MSEKIDKIDVRDVIQVDSELIENISTLIENQAKESLMNIFANLHPADIAEIINNLNIEKASFAFELLDNETAGEVLIELDENLREKLLKRIDAETISDIVEELDTDDATDIVSELPEELADAVLEKLDREESEDVKKLLEYPEDSAGGIMNSDFVYVYEDNTIKGAIKEIRKHAEEFEHIYHIYVLNHSDQLVGIVYLKSLLTNPLRQKITSVMEEDLIYVNPNTDQEEVAALMDKYDLVAIPVVDSNKVMLGRITIDDVVDVINEEASEDIQKIVGLSEEQESSDSVFRISRIRLPWLIIGLVLEVLNALILSNYEASLTQILVATFFMPIVMAVGGSSGTQSAIVMVRSLGSKEIWLKEVAKKLGKELFVSLINGIVLSSILFSLVFLFFSQETVTISFTLILCLSLQIIILFSTMMGAAIPIVLKKMGLDPAIATGPFVTSSNDIIGLLIYLSLVTWFML
ncbi:MAG: magnesium transporter [Ignavibacteriae bacterium]|nr:magnesium transporter [Ignavibacteriota bacterium]